MGGGVPLTSEDQVIAGVGVSGGTTEQDVAIVEAAMREIVAMPWKCVISAPAAGDTDSRNGSSATLAVGGARPSTVAYSWSWHHHYEKIEVLPTWKRSFMYFPDNFAGVTAVSERVHRLRSAVVAHRNRPAAPQTGGTLAETRRNGGVSALWRAAKCVDHGVPRYRDPVPGADIVAIWQPGDTEHAEHVRTSPCRKPLPDLPLQPIVSGRYHDCFERSDGQWRFVERRVRTDLVGDVTRHLRHAAAGR